MKKKSIMGILVVGILVITLGVVFLGNESISVVTAKGVEVSFASREVADIEHDDVSSFIELCTSKDIPYVDLDTKVEFRHDGKKVKNAKLYEYILKENGERKYNKSIYKPLEFTESNDKIFIPVGQNFMTGLSSNTDDYKPGNTFRGFRLVFNDGSKNQEYCFVLRTDAM